MDKPSKPDKIERSLLDQLSALRIAAAYYDEENQDEYAELERRLAEYRSNS